MKTLLLLILINNPNGSQHIQTRMVLPESTCLDIEAAIWEGTSPVVGHDSDGKEINLIDAACVPLGSE